MTLSDWLHHKPMRSQILLIVGIVATITIGVVFAVAVGMFSWIGTDSRDLVSSSLEDQAKEYLQQSSTGTADTIDKKFLIMEEAVAVVASGLSYMFKDATIPFNPIESYLWWNDTTLPRDAAYNPRWNYSVSQCCSSIYVTAGSYENLSISMQNTQIADRVTRSAHLDLFFPQLVYTHTDIAQMQIGFANDVPLLRRFPAISAERSRDYDHTNRPWYVDAAKATGAVIYSDPYRNSITHEWTISISKSVTTPRTGLLAVSALEMRTNTLQQSILSQQLFTTGYALLLQSNGVVVAGRVWDSTQETLVKIDDIAGNLKISDFLPFGTPKVQRKTIDGQDMLVSQSGLIRNRYIIVHVANRAEILASVERITTNIDSNNNKLLAITAAVGVGTLVVVLVFSSILTTRVVKPVGTISDVALKIVRNTTKANIMENIPLFLSISISFHLHLQIPLFCIVFFDGKVNVAYSEVEFQEDEIGDLARAFSAMVDKLSGKPSNHQAVPIDTKHIEMRNL